ncbi:MAG TPA: RidA family protein [Verrucomicrobiae bacterium]|nr:RidA family protein [Verrucomicrobiae bacterium]
MSERRTITTDRAPQAVGPYSQAVRNGPFLFLSGQVGLDPETKALVPGGLEAETTRVFENIKAVLEAAGASLDQVMKTTVFLTDMKDFQAMNAIYARVFGDARPARSTVQVAALPLGARVEIEAIAMLEG